MLRVWAMCEITFHRKVLAKCHYQVVKSISLELGGIDCREMAFTKYWSSESKDIFQERFCTDSVFFLWQEDESLLTLSSV